jgi:hypothetical protein
MLSGRIKKAKGGSIMKLKEKIVLAAVFWVAMSLSMLPAAASADSYDCAQCTVTRLGMNPGAFGTDGFMIQVEDAAGLWSGSRTFYLDDTLGKAGWATVLTGYSMGKTFWMRLVDTVPGSLITVVHIND